MANRARQRRERIPGYRAKPSKEDRKLERRRVRRAVEVELSRADPEEVVLPTARPLQDEHATVHLMNGDRVPHPGRSYKPVQKTPFWKRRDKWRSRRAEMARRYLSTRPELGSIEGPPLPEDHEAAA